MIYALKPGANPPGRRALVSLLEGIGKGLAEDISTMLRDEHVSITKYGWTSCANDSYYSLTVAFITPVAPWELVALPLSCTNPRRPGGYVVSRHDPLKRVM